MVAPLTVAAVITALTFNNLISGRTYKVCGFFQFVHTLAADDPSIVFKNTDGTAISRLGQAGNLASGSNLFMSPSFIFLAPQNGSLTVEKEFASGTVETGSFITLEEVSTSATTQ